MTKLVSVAIPVRDGAEALERTLAGVRAQRLDPPVSIELIVRDSVLIARSLADHLPRAVGALLGARARDLPVSVVRRLRLGAEELIAAARAGTRNRAARWRPQPSATVGPCG